MNALLEHATRGWNDLIAFAWPERCPACGNTPERGALLCAECFSRIPPVAFGVCARCLVREAADPICARHPGFRVWPAWVYDERLARVMEAFKYDRRTDLAGPLAAGLARVAPPGFAADVVTGIPLHPSRLRERGYNPSDLLAECLAERRRVPHVPGVLDRVRATPAQARLGPAARRRNVSGAFRVRHPERWRGRRVLLVDDVLTTGATLEAALETLRRAGVHAEAVVTGWAQ